MYNNSTLSRYDIEVNNKGLISIFVHLGQPSGQQTENMSDDVEMQERVNEDGDPIIHGDLIR